MRTLLLMRGSAGVGKSTWIKNNGLSEYCLCADDIRMMYQSPILKPDGTESIAFQNDKAVWETLFQLLEARMQRGEFVVIDATNSKTSEMTRHRDLAQTYRYRIFCVDFTDVPIDEVKRRNKQRPPYKQVPEAAIDNMYARFATQKIPAGIKAIKPDELDSIWLRKIDLSEYKKIHHIGDIHGCYTALKEYFKDGLQDDEYYIFCGDYIDRGIENVEVLNFLLEIYEKKNVLLLEGNHEHWLWHWSHGRTGQSKEFEMVTRKALEAADVDPKVIRMLYRKLGQCAYYTYRGKTVLVTHAGLSKIPDNLSTVATEQMIRGVGAYGDYLTVAESFEKFTDENTYQIFGHRNTEQSPTQLSARVFDLEGRVEFGGELRTVTLSESGFEVRNIKNTVFKIREKEEKQQNYTHEEKSVMKVVDELQHNNLISVKKFGDISSFNFKRAVFYDKKWDEQTIKARGLFINTADGKVAARAYPKFFNINERPETEYDNLKLNMKFPAVAYVKENGFLALVSYDPANDDFLICSKSTPEGSFAELARKMFDQKVQNRDELKEYIKRHDVTLVFECVDMENDPHIIEYDHSDLYLLNIVKNDLNFKKESYQETCRLAKEHGFNVKTKAADFGDWEDFKAWYKEVLDEDYLFDGRHIEGFVIEDSAGFMLKLKLYYYSFWKQMRSVARETLSSGNFRRTGSLTTPEANLFFGFCKELHAHGQDPQTHIMTLRKIFQERMSENKNGLSG